MYEGQLCVKGSFAEGCLALRFGGVTVSLALHADTGGLAFILTAGTGGVVFYTLWLV